MSLLQDLVEGRLTIAVVGLGYVGLPLAAALSRRFTVIGFDANTERIAALRAGIDASGELRPDELSSANVRWTTDPADLRGAGLLIACVPTPVDPQFNPDLGPVQRAAEIIGAHLRAGAIVVLESTVGPGMTEHDFVPVLERSSGLRAGAEFGYGFSPERINPGDRTHGLADVVKVVSGDCPATVDVLADVYGSVVRAGVHRAASIRAAELAKLFENIQRDVNIALTNELAMVCHRLGVPTRDVLEAARTKWNFLPFSPGLVGGHCVAVNPYYFSAAARAAGHVPTLTLAARLLNEQFPDWLADELAARLPRFGARVLQLGFAFKENVADARSSRALMLAECLARRGCNVALFDPLVAASFHVPPGLLRLERLTDAAAVDAVLVAVPHARILDAWDLHRLQRLASPAGDWRPLLIDLKAAFAPAPVQAAGFDYWAL